MFENHEVYVNEIIGFTQNAWDKSVDFTTKFNNFVEPVTPILDATGLIISGVTPIINGLQSLIHISSRLRFNKFLKHFSMTADVGNLTEKQTIKMRKYLNNEKNLIYISDLISSSIQSQSADCSGVMGYYAGLLLKNSQAINYQDTVVLNALKVMTKRDLDNFIQLYVTFSGFKKVIRTFDEKSKFEEFEVPIFEMENTIEKMKNIQVFGFDIGGIDGVGNAWGAFEFNENTHYFHDILIKSRIINITPIQDS